MCDSSLLQSVSVPLLNTAPALAYSSLTGVFDTWMETLFHSEVLYDLVGETMQYSEVVW